MKNFLDKEDYMEWKRRCTKQRYIAAKNPCYDKAMVTCVDFELSCGPEWNLRLVLETFTDTPIWHASISHITQIGGEVVYEKSTGLPIFVAPQDAMVVVKEWSHEERDVADSLLGDLMGPLIPSKDTHVEVTEVVLALHWIVDAIKVNEALAARN